MNRQPSHLPTRAEALLGALAHASGVTGAILTLGALFTYANPVYLALFPWDASDGQKMYTGGAGMLSILLGSCVLAGERLSKNKRAASERARNKRG